MWIVVLSVGMYYYFELWLQMRLTLLIKRTLLINLPDDVFG